MFDARRVLDWEGSGMSRIAWRIAGLATAALLAASAAQATPITFTETVTGSGLLGGDSFTNAVVTFTGTADTGDVVGAYQISHLPLSVDVADLGSADFTDDILLFANSVSSDIGFGDTTTGFALLFVGGFPGGYNLQSDFSLTGPAIVNPGQSSGTTAGAFLFSSTAETAVFDAKLSPTPEPAAWALMIAGFGLTGVALRRRRAAIA
jgi:PEP-CTERM motif